MSGYVQDAAGGDGFERSREMFESLVSMLRESAADEWTHTDLEDRLAAPGRELLRGLTQDHLDLRADREQSAYDVVDAGGVAHTRLECEHERTLTTVYGPVQVRRKAYRAPGVGEPVPGGCGVEPAGRQALARAAAAGRGGGDARVVRGGRRGDRTGHRDDDRQAAGRGPHPGRCGSTWRRSTPRTAQPQPATRRTSWCCPRTARGW